MTEIINWNDDETKMTQALVFLEGCALQLPSKLLQLKNSLLIEIMQQLNQSGKQARLYLFYISTDQNRSNCFTDLVAIGFKSSTSFQQVNQDLGSIMSHCLNITPLVESSLKK